MTLQGAILDIDGTLIDSNAAHAQSWVDALAEFGHRASVEQVRRLIGQGGDKLLPQVAGLQEESPEGKAISERRSAIFKTRYLPHVRGLPGAHELLQHMKDRGLRLVVATSANEDEAQALLEVVDADGLIEKRTTSSDVKHSKPDPDVVGVALKRLGAPADQAVMLGDTPWDVQAANEAGVPIIAFRSGGWEDGDLRGAAAIYDNPADLLAHYDESPLTSRR
jgi:HAD superfamily hydrolase (TIGR01509 family)